jgi:hypothetical protein
MGILIFKGLTVQRVYMSLGVKRLTKFPQQQKVAPLFTDQLSVLT